MKKVRYLVVIAGLLFVLGLASCTGAEEATAPTLVPATTAAEAEAPASPAPTAAEVGSTALPTTSAEFTDLYQGTAEMPWWNDAVFYEVFVRSFYDSDGDGVGDINGLIEKLDYLNDGDPQTMDDLGVTGIWLMPIMESPSYHGYDVVDYYQVDEEYGTQEDFRRLLEEAHARGIRVIVDLVSNHTSREHPWFAASRDPASDKRDWYIWRDEDPGYRGPQGQQVWHRTPDGYYYALFWEGMPDLNYENPQVTAEMENVARFWLEEMDVDGFRLDAIKHIVENGELQENTKATHEWLQGFYTFYKGINPDALTVGEAWTSTPEVLKYTGDEVDIAFQFDLAGAMLSSANFGLSSMVSDVQKAVVEDFPPGQYATFLTNHDQDRVMSQLGGDEDKAKLAAIWLLTSPGVPFVYYGEEIGMTGTKPDEDIRRPMQWASDEGRGVGFTSAIPWRDPAADYEERSVAIQTDNADSLLNHYRELVRLRNEHAALRVGDWVEVETDESAVYAFLRTFEDEVLLVLLNFSDEPIADYSLTLREGSLVSSDEAQSLFGQGDAQPPELNDAGGFADYRPIDVLPPQSGFVIQL